jgi:hypothetical protein
LPGPLHAGAAVQEGPDAYRFTGQQLRHLAHLLNRVAQMVWQQALLFPEVCARSLTAFVLL